ncbi:MAG TPA: glycosyltransferase family 39 protein [Solirubrobacteraceae bacterium]|jgi:4-amino-4-deoxy-L-arabinose transferase-like glycosyltransferase|nr:glycosyltransferase family 39 protein [Solirubrobacteraceae bacterium]
MRRRAQHRGPAWAWAAIALITLGAAVLRLVHIGKVSPDPYYDAAVRSMGLSWHNFFLGAFEPGGSVSIDKPPVDLWLQVASVKLLGFSSTTLKLPEALAGIAAVPLLFAAVRRMWSTAAGLAAAVALAVLPVEVITSRSDTMDGVMMALIVLALWLIVRACETGRYAWLLAGAAALGVAFDVKLLESLVAVPGLALLAYLGLPGSRSRRLLQLAAAGAVYVAVALAWLTATLLVPAHERPYAIGSTNGSAWNAAFVFNGTDRLGGKSPEPQFTIYEPGHRYPEATQSERDHIPIVPPSPTRLLARVGPLSGERLGLELLVALLLGAPALIFTLLADRRAAPQRDGQESSEKEAALAREAATGRRMRRATAAGLSLWMLTGIALFSHMSRLHPRYVESLVPAVAALLGIGAAWACATDRETPDSRARLVALAVALGATVYYVERLLYGRTGVWWVVLAGAFGAIAFAALARVGPRADGLRARWLAGATIALALVAVGALPLSADVTAINNAVTDAGYVGALPSEEQSHLSSYLRAHQGGARYELAAESATQIGSLIVQDARPVLVLTTYGARVFTNVAELRQRIAKGEVRYAFLNSFCGKRISPLNAACSEPARWIRAHGTDVSRRAGLSRGGVLWLLPGAKP